MSVEVIQCPACQHQLRVPESLFGEPVTCPQCRITFRAPRRLADGTMEQPEMLAQTSASAAKAKSSSKLLMPGLAVFLVGVMGLFSNGLIVYRCYNDPDKLIDEYVEILKEPAYQKMLEGKQITRDEVKEAVNQGRQWFIGMGVLSAIVVAGGIGILTSRFYWLSVIASGIAIVNPPCCCLGLPAGIFGLVRLFDPDSRALFGISGREGGLPTNSNLT